MRHCIREKLTRNWSWHGPCLLKISWRRKKSSSPPSTTHYPYSTPSSSIAHPRLLLGHSLAQVALGCFLCFSPLVLINEKKIKLVPSKEIGCIQRAVGQDCAESIWYCWIPRTDAIHQPVISGSHSVRSPMQVSHSRCL